MNLINCLLLGSAITACFFSLLQSFDITVYLSDAGGFHLGFLAPNFEFRVGAFNQLPSGFLYRHKPYFEGWRPSCRFGLFSPLIFPGRCVNYRALSYAINIPACMHFLNLSQDKSCLTSLSQGTLRQDGFGQDFVPSLAIAKDSRLGKKCVFGVFSVLPKTPKTPKQNLAKTEDVAPKTKTPKDSIPKTKDVLRQDKDLERHGSKTKMPKQNA
ncbi:hypothetical protein B0H13DRAFT_2287140 [Mycena leptocephala]|nr:hypothetical protein B0H13DRAFT_2287140 [Mycena leptocephala]